MSYGEQHATIGRGPLPLAALGVSARPRTALPEVRNPGFRPGNAGSIPAPCTSQRPRPKGSARRLQPLARPLTATRGHHQRRHNWPPMYEPHLTDAEVTKAAQDKARSVISTATAEAGKGHASRGGALYELAEG